MRILAATDGSTPAGVGCDLARDVATLAGGEIRFVAVLPPTVELFAGLSAAEVIVDTDALERAAVERLEGRLEAEVDRTTADLRPTWCLRRGRPSEEIVAEAARWRADLIVVGSRGHGALASIVLGSVSEDVVDHSPIPVLVARNPRMRRLVVAVDGSPASEAGVDLVATGTTFRGLDAWVVDVAPSVYPWWLGLSLADPGATDQLMQMSDDARVAEHVAAEAATRRLRDAGVHANTRHCIGDAADELLRSAGMVGADTIVIASRGRTSLTRAFAGSVARQVLRHAGASVLVVKPPARAENVVISEAASPTAAGLPTA